MVQYNPKDWITFIFRFHKSDTFRTLIPMMITIGLYSYAVAYLEIEYWKLSEASHVKNITIMHGMLGFVISLLLVFRTNTAYDRWWEGRKHWGALVNNSRNLALKLSAILKDENDRAFFRKIIPSYASMLQKHLTDDKTAKMLFDDLELQIDQHKHRPNQVAKMLIQKINDLHTSGKISGDQLIIINHEMQSFTDICGACERIKNTPIPYSYSAFIKKFIFFYIMTLPFGYVFNLGYYVIPVVVFTFYVLASLELIAEEIEDPFGNDANDLPTDKIASNIKKHVEEIL
ncbi:membrane protein [Flavobacterium sp. 316]|uniref:bestrophin family protein n=1 Tax=Flavobacterium sp. 316 TaxID=1603293 RepID=UPI0005E3A564|nr:bestrophin family ion channel [Flavobacterium sp. 316]KIX22791.1 membrane protein [Flavobacterium sp. 316]